LSGRANGRRVAATVGQIRIRQAIEHVSDALRLTLGILARQATQGAKLVAADRMRAGRAFLGPAALAFLPAIAIELGSGID
jgi:hypothetical protein